MAHIGPAYSREDADQYFDRVIKKLGAAVPPYKVWAITESGKGHSHGIISLLLPKDTEAWPEIGIMMKPFVRIKNMTLFAMRDVQQWVKLQTQYDGMIAHIGITNNAAQRFARRCGFEHQSEQKWAWFSKDKKLSE